MLASLLLPLSASLLALAGTLRDITVVDNTVTVDNTHPLIHYHGRWDDAPGTWWAGSGFKLNVVNLKTLALNLGVHTEAVVRLAVSVDGSPFTTVVVSPGTHQIPLPATNSTKARVVRINVQGWQNNRIHLESLTFNEGAVLNPYVPSRLSILFLGDSLAAGMYLPDGDSINLAWPYLAAETMKAEAIINAQPGVTVVDMVAYGNNHGMIYQFFKTEDTGAWWSLDHNYTTDWDFSRDKPTPTHIIMHLGSNDASFSVSNEEFINAYLAFLVLVRVVYPKQPIFLMSQWGWVQVKGNRVDTFYVGLHGEIVKRAKAKGEKNIFLIDTTGWVTYDDVFYDNPHPTIEGNARIAQRTVEWLKRWGLKIPA